MIDEVMLDACIRTMIALKVPKATILQYVSRLFASSLCAAKSPRCSAKAFLAIVLLTYWLDPKPPFCQEKFDVIELYAGRARITRMAQAAGYRAVAADTSC